MPKISAIIHTRNDAPRLGRLLETLRPCDQVLIIDDSPDDSVEKVAHEYGADVRRCIPGVSPGAYSMDSMHEWILCVLPNESLSEGLEASLFSWKDGDPKREDTFAVIVREEKEGQWSESPSEVRLINRSCVNWTDRLPPNLEGAFVLPGHLLRFDHP
jgi:glycosyltransferase involved in cell wall biosynthesis